MLNHGQEEQLQGPEREQKSFAAGVICRAKELVAKSVQTLSNGWPESVRDEALRRLHADIDEALKDLAKAIPNGAAAGKQPEQEAVEIGQVVAEVIKEIGRLPDEFSRAASEPIAGFVHKMVPWFSRETNSFIRIRADLAKDALDSGSIAPLLFQETELEAMAQMALSMAVIAAGSTLTRAVSCIVLRHDFEAALDGAPETMPSFFCPRDYLYGKDGSSPEFRPPEDWTSSDLAFLAEMGVFKSRFPAECSADDLKETKADLHPFLTENRLFFFPISHGAVYLGALLLLRPPGKDHALSPQEKRDLLLVATGCAQGLAHLRRVNAARPPRDIDFDQR